MRPVLAKGVKSRGRKIHNLLFGCFFFVLDVWQDGGSCGLGVELIDYGFPPGPSVLSPGGISLLRPLVGSSFFSFFFVQRGRIFIVFSPQEGKGREKGKGGLSSSYSFLLLEHIHCPGGFFLFQGRILRLRLSWAADAADAEDLSALLWRTVKAAKREVGESGKELPPLPTHPPPPLAPSEMKKKKLKKVKKSLLHKKIEKTRDKKTKKNLLMEQVRVRKKREKSRTNKGRET